MDVNEALTDAFERVRGVVHRTLDGLEVSALLWRPDPQANSIAWLVWHLTRIHDDHVSEIAGRGQIWVEHGWARRFGLPAGYADTGYGHAPEQVAAIAPGDARLLVDYHDEVVDATTADLAGLAPGDYDRVIDHSYDPPVTVGVRLVSVIADSLQHAGQAAYLRGLFERRGDPGATGTGRSEVELEDVPDEVRSRILAATAHAAHRRVAHVPAGEDGPGDPGRFLVEAVAGDRVSVMELALRPDGSVAETTRSLTVGDVVTARGHADGVELVVRSGDTPIVISPDTAAAAGLSPADG